MAGAGFPSRALTVSSVTVTGASSFGSTVSITRATPYAFMLLTRSDQPASPPVQIDIDSGGLVISPQTGAGLLSKTVGFEIAKLDGAGDQQFSLSIGEDRINTAASLFRIMEEDGATYLGLAALQFVATGNGTASNVAVVLGGTYGTGIFRDSVSTEGVATAVANETKVIAWGAAGTSLFSLVQNNARLTFGASTDAEWARVAAASLRMGGASSASPTAQTLTIGEGSRGGTDSNIAGAGGTIRSSLGTGTGTLATLKLQGAVVAASGTTQQTYGTFIEGSGTTLGFYGVTPIARAVLATGTGATVDNVITALQNLGLLAQS